ncbi:MAG: sensor domain-containing diguanylate cyclase [Thermomicrobiales bacterium]
MTQPLQRPARQPESVALAAAILTSFRGGVCAVDQHGRITLVNPAAQGWLGWLESELVGRPMHEAIHARRPDGGSVPSTGWALWPVLLSGAIVENDDDVFTCRDGSFLPVGYTAAPLHANGRIIGAVVTFSAIAPRKRMEAALRRERDFARQVMETIGQGVTVADRQDRYLYVNPAFARMLGRTTESLIGRTLTDLAEPDDHPIVRRAREERLQGRQATYEVRLCHSGGYPIHARITDVPRYDDDEQDGTIAAISDVTDEILLQERLQWQASYDALTGLPNRTLFWERLGEALARSNRRGETVGLLFLDLDGFKGVNDRFGHEVGDALLSTAATRLQRCVRESDTVARMGGDEFTIVLDGPMDQEGARRVALAAIAELETPIVVGGEVLALSTSVGVALSTVDTRPEDLVRAADAAMYDAKRAGKGRYAFSRHAPEDWTAMQHALVRLRR